MSSSIKSFALLKIFLKTKDEAKDMRLMTTMLTDKALMRVIMTITMMMMMSVRRKSDVWVYWTKLIKFETVRKIMKRLLKIICKHLSFVLNLMCFWVMCNKNFRFFRESVHVSKKSVRVDFLIFKNQALLNQIFLDCII